MMNVKQSFKDAALPTGEVITRDGQQHLFPRFRDGERYAATRSIPGLFKGTACIDPRGYPLLFVGQGIPVDNDEGNPSRMCASFSDFRRTDRAVRRV
ncbi:MAG: hypothetical protein R2912_10950 [Eubacteriales bacterium]